ncbi:MAG: TIR domain-containing protein [Eubacteriales bacterium]
MGKKIKLGTVKVTRKVTVTQQARTTQQMYTPTYTGTVSPNTNSSSPAQTSKQITTTTKRYIKPDKLPAGIYSPQVETLYEEFNNRQKTEIDENSVLYDVFISHASEDKEGFVNELVEVLQNAGIRVWYDALEMQWGKSLREQIDNGIKRSKFAIVVLSKNFFSKQWTKRELDGILVKEEKTGAAPLPIWHNISYDEVYQFSPTLTGLYALSTDKLTTQDICKALLLTLEKEEV